MKRIFIRLCPGITRTVVVLLTAMCTMFFLPGCYFAATPAEMFCHGKAKRSSVNAAEEEKYANNETFGCVKRGTNHGHKKKYFEIIPFETMHLLFTDVPRTKTEQ